VFFFFFFKKKKKFENKHKHSVNKTFPARRLIISQFGNLGSRTNYKPYDMMS